MSPKLLPLYPKRDVAQQPLIVQVLHFVAPRGKQGDRRRSTLGRVKARGIQRFEQYNKWGQYEQ